MIKIIHTAEAATDVIKNTEQLIELAVVHLNTSCVVTGIITAAMSNYNN